MVLSLLVGCADTRAVDGGQPDSGAGIDAEVDAGGTDAGDAGLADAGSDGGIDSGADAGPSDAGPVRCPPGLAAWWRYEETSGPVLDECGLHDGASEGSGLSRGVTGRSGLAIEFGGTDGRVRVPAAATLDFLTAATIELWVRVDTTNVGSTVSRGTGNNDDNVLQNSACWNMQTIFSQTASGTTSVTSACSTLPVGTWAHVAVVNDGTELRLYIDGALETTSPGGHLGPLASDLYMGRREQGVFALDGAIDELKWWTIARTQAEICADAGGSWSGTACTL